MPYVGENKLFITISKVFSVFFLAELNVSCFTFRKMDAIHTFAREGEVDNLLKCIEGGISVNLRGFGLSFF